MLNLGNYQFEKKDIGLWLTLLLPVVFHQAGLSFLNRWLDNTSIYSHGLLLGPLAIIIVIINYQRNRANILLQPSYLFLIPITALIFVWLLATVSFTEVIAQFALLGLMTCVFCYFYGTKALSHIYLSIGLLLSVTPFWDVLNIPLREIATYANHALLNLTGFSNYRDGFFIHIAAGIFHVDTGCSGLNQFVVAVAISLVYAWYSKLNTMQTICVMLSAVVFAIIANIVRIYIIIALGQLTNMQHYFITVEHVSLGWIVFAIFIYLFFIFCDRVFTSKKFIPQYDLQGKMPQNCASSLILLLICLPASLYASYMLYASPVSNTKNSKIEPYGLSQLNNKISNWQPSIIGATHTLHTTTQHKGKPIDLHIYFYARQKQHKEAVNNKHTLETSGWHIKEFDDQDTTFNIFTIENHSKQKLSILQSYWVRDRFYKHPGLSKVMNGLNTIFGNPHIAYIILSTKLEDHSILLNFTKTKLDTLNELLQKHSETLLSGS